MRAVSRPSALRVRQQNANALAIVRFLEGHRAIAEVAYPGLESHPDHARAAELFDGFGPVLSFRHADGLDAAEKLLKALELPYVAPSLGGVETLITHPAITSHAGMSPEARTAEGIEDDLVRLVVGIEATEDLLDDFKNALDSI